MCFDIEMPIYVQYTEHISVAVAVAVLLKELFMCCGVCVCVCASMSECGDERAQRSTICMACYDGTCFTRERGETEREERQRERER